jgi:hypothetical protein
MGSIVVPHAEEKETFKVQTSRSSAETERKKQIQLYRFITARNEVGNGQVTGIV